jgi:hypothetical protein
MGLDAYGTPVEAKAQITDHLNELQAPTSSAMPHQETRLQDDHRVKFDRAACESENSNSRSDTCTPDGWESWQGPDACDEHPHIENVGMYQNANRANMVSWESKSSGYDQVSDAWSETTGNPDRAEHGTIEGTDDDSLTDSPSGSSWKAFRGENASGDEMRDPTESPENAEWVPEEEWRNRYIQVQ